MMAPLRFSVCGFGLLCCSVWLVAASAHAADPVIDSVMYQDPALSVAGDQTKLPVGIVDLWLEALARPEIEMRSQAALALAQAHRLGFKQPDKAIPRLLDVLNKAGQDSLVRSSVAQALVDLDARTAAPTLWKQAQSGDEELRRVVEPALAHWQYKPAGTVWLERLGQHDASGQDLLLAIRGLAALRENRAVAPLRGLVVAQDRPPAVRLEAARALGAIQTSGLEADARTLLQDKADGVTARLSALALLQHHKSAAAIQLLQGALHDAEPAVVRAALDRLIQLDPKTVLPALPALLANRDAGVRKGAVEVLFREINADRLSLLAQRCDDPHPDVRRLARRYLHQLAARPELRPTILKLTSGLLGGSDWRGQEQAALLVGQLDYKPVVSRLIELLKSSRPEVCVATAWALRKLAVPATLPAVLAYVRDLHFDVVPSLHSTPTRAVILPVFDAQMSQLIQLLGQLRYQPAEPVLRTFVPRMARKPRPPIGPEARAATIWALGLLHEGHPEPTLVRDLEHRLLVLLKPFQGGDAPQVARMFPVSLARMKSQSSVKALRKYYNESAPAPTQVRSGTAWALHQLTGETFRPDPPIQRFAGNWFLSPVERSKPAKP